jgi:hypothetical protein
MPEVQTHVRNYNLYDFVLYRSPRIAIRRW